MTTTTRRFETRCLSSLTKVFADEELTDSAYCHGSALWNETYAFQVAYRNSDALLKGMRVRIDSDLAHVISVRSVGLVPSELPAYHDGDGRVLRTRPGLYPDPLYPLYSHGDGGDGNDRGDNSNVGKGGHAGNAGDVGHAVYTGEGLVGYPGQWRAVWVTVHLSEDVAPGVHPIRVAFGTATGELLGEETFTLDVIPQALPEQRLIHTEWFHADCLAVYYGDDVFSEAHWRRIAQYVDTAAQHGVNTILTPLFTPPLDTAVGGERPTVQLVDVEKVGDQYTFGFARLSRWIACCRSRGMRYFEFSHLFTQWGARHAPKIVATENGEQRKIFGWKTDAAGSDYEQFLDQFLPELVRYIKQHRLEKHVFFHVSDEPHAEHLSSYRQASRLLHRHLAAFPLIDALSDYSFYEQGLVKNPIPASDHIEPFLENGVPNLWTYYCCSQYKDVSNRFFNFPSARNRVLGMQLYKYDIAGFLHWGYNYWFSQYSRRAIDPFRTTDADAAFPSGDAFLVYPGDDGPIESIRLEVFYEALQDLRALQLLETLVGKEKVLALLQEDLERPLTFRDYPVDSDWLLRKREAINRKIAAAVK